MIVVVVVAVHPCGCKQNEKKEKKKGKKKKNRGHLLRGPRYIEPAEVAVGGDSRLRRGGDNRRGRRQRGTYCRRQKVVVAIGRGGGL